MQTNEIFSVGLAMLEAMTLSPAIEAYDLSNLKIRTSFYTERYSELQNGPYSSTLRELVFSCFANKNDRPSFQQFMKVIKMWT